MAQGPISLNRDELHLGYIDVNKNEVRNLRLHQLGADPSSPVNGLLLYRTDTNKVRARVNGAWVDMATMDDVTAAGISSNLIDAKGDLLVGTADNTVARKAVGADGTFLVGASGQSDGLQWRALATGDIPASLLQEKLATSDLTDWPRAAALDVNNQKITSLANGTANSDAANYGQLLAVSEGKLWKDPVRAATTAAGTLASSFENGDAIDGVTLATGDRILIKNQASASENGIYTVNASGAPTRALDANTATEINKATVIITEGTSNQGDVYTQTATVATLDTDTVTFTKTGEGNTTYTSDGTTVELVGNSFRIAATAAGNGLTGGGGSALAVNTGSGLEISSDAVRIAAAAAGAGLTGGAGSALAVGAGTGITVNADDVAVDTAVVVRKAVGALTGGANSEVLTHNLGTRDISKVTLINNASPYDVQGELYFEATTTNTVTIYAASGQNLPASYRYIVTG